MGVTTVDFGRIVAGQFHAQFPQDVLFFHIRELADRILGVAGAQTGVVTRDYFVVVGDDRWIVMQASFQ